MIQFCEHQKCEPCKPPICTAYIFNHEHPVCAYTNENFAFHNCKSFKKTEPRTIDQRLAMLEIRVENLVFMFEEYINKEK